MILHILVCLALIGIVLLQHGKGAGIGAAFGGSSQTVFGSTGAAPFLAKLTAVAAILFMCTSLGLTVIGRHQEKASIMQETRPAPAKPAPAKSEVPAQPEAPGKSEAPAAPAPAQPAPAAPGR
jgi:preprotein translocase subunit SecG